MHVFVDTEENIIAAGPTQQYTDKLHSEPHTEWTVNARSVIRTTSDPQHPYEIARQILDNNGNHFEYQYTYPCKTYQDAILLFAAEIQNINTISKNAIDRQKIQEPQPFTNPLTILQTAVDTTKDDKIIATLAEVHTMPREGRFSLTFHLPYAEEETFHKNNYETLKRLVGGYYPDAEFRDPHTN